MRYDFHACTWLVNTRAEWRHLIWRHLVICVSLSDRAKVARGSDSARFRGSCHVFSLFLSVIILLWNDRLPYFFFWKCVKNSRDFKYLTAKLPRHRLPCFFDDFLIFFWAQKQFFPFYHFSCPLFKFAVNGFIRTVFSEIQSEKIISNEPFSDEIFASAMKKREKFVKLYSSPASNVQLLVQVLYITRSARSLSLKCFLQLANWKKWRKMASN